jgi:hypothetical protein
MRDEFSQKIITTVAKRAGYHCSNPECRKLTIGASKDNSKSTLIGIASHITAASEGGPRYDPQITKEERMSLENAIWLCGNCSILIDKDRLRFPVNVLLQWKSMIENESSQELKRNISQSTIGLPVKHVEKEFSFQEKAELIKEKRRKQMEIEAFLESYDAVIEAKSQVKLIISKLKEYKELLEDPKIGLYLGEVMRKDEMYGIGYGETYLAFNLCCPNEYKVSHLMLRVSIFKMEGHHGINYKETPIKLNNLRYTKNENNEGGWVQFENGSNFTSTLKLTDSWIDEFISLAKLNR